MTKDEYLADLATKVVWPPVVVAGPVVTSPPDPAQSNQAIVAAIEANEVSGLGTKTTWVAPVVTIGPIGVYNDQQVRFQVLNYGVEGAETVLPIDRIENPKGDVFDAVTYWETRKANPADPVLEYREITGEDKRSDLGFYKMKVWFDNGDGTTRESEVLTRRDANGDPETLEIA